MNYFTTVKLVLRTRLWTTSILSSITRDCAHEPNIPKTNKNCSVVIGYKVLHLCSIALRPPKLLGYLNYGHTKNIDLHARLSANLIIVVASA